MESTLMDHNTQPQTEAQTETQATPPQDITVELFNKTSENQKLIAENIHTEQETTEKLPH